MCGTTKKDCGMNKWSIQEKDYIYEEERFTEEVKQINQVNR